MGCLKSKPILVPDSFKDDPPAYSKAAPTQPHYLDSVYNAPKYVDGRKYFTNREVRHAVTDAGLAIMFDMQLLEDEFYRLAMMKKHWLPDDGEFDKRDIGTMMLDDGWFVKNIVAAGPPRVALEDGKELERIFQKLQKRAQQLVDTIENVVTAAFAKIPGKPPASIRSLELPNAVQPVTEKMKTGGKDSEGVDVFEFVEMDDFSPEMTTVLEKCAVIIKKSAADTVAYIEANTAKAKENAAANVFTTDGWSGEPGQFNRAQHRHGFGRNAKVLKWWPTWRDDTPRAADEQNKTGSVFPILKEVLTHEKKIEPFRYLMAQCVVINADFHAEMATLVGPEVVAYKPANMKSDARIMYKVFADYLDNQKPQSQFVKDVVRGTILIDTFVQLEKAYAVLTAKHPPVIVKNRLREATRDVLVVIRFMGILCEVQFHFASIVAIKAYSHFPYNIVRATDAIELFEFPKSRMEETKRSHFYALFTLGVQGAIKGPDADAPHKSFRGN